MVEVECPYKDVCTSYPHKCSRCKHNRRRDYFEPVEKREPWSEFPPRWKWVPPKFPPRWREITPNTIIQ